VLAPGPAVPDAAPGAGTDSVDRLRLLVADVLRVPVTEVRPGEPATHSGLDSLGALRVSDRAADELGLVITPSALLGEESLAGLARTATPAGVEGHRALPAGATSFPLTIGQQAILFQDRTDPTAAAFNLPVAVEITGELDQAALRTALADVVARHPALRTTADAAGLTQHVHPAAPVDLRRLPVGATGTGAAIHAETMRPLDPAEPGGVLRATLLEPTGGTPVLLLVVHHSAADEWALDLLVRDLHRAYTARLRAEPPRWPAPPATMAEAAERERRLLSSAEGAASLGRWSARMTGAPALTEVPRDHPRPATRGLAGGEVPIALGTEDSAALYAFARARTTTPFVVVAAALHAVLARFTGQSDVILGVPAARRDKAAARDLAGLLMNPVPLRIRVDGGTGLGGLVRAEREVVAAARADEDLPFARLVEHLGLAGSPATTPLFQTMLAWHAARDRELPTAGGAWRLAAAPQPGTPVGVVIDLHDLGDRIEGTVRYATGLYRPETAARLADALTRLLRAGVAEPDRPVRTLPVIGPADLRRITRDWASGPLLPRPVPDVLDRFDVQVAAHPDDVAVQAGEQTLTYRELAGRSGRLAEAMLAAGAGPGAPVALLLDRSPALVTAVLAALRAGAPYVPLDPDLPEARRAVVLKDSGAALMLSTGGLAAVARPARPDPGTRPGLAYVIFTSGSTGRPKGVMVERRSVNALLTDFAGRLGSTAPVLLALTSIDFDIAVLELLLPLVTGGRVVLAPRGAAMQPYEVLDLLKSTGATHLQATPSTLSVLCDAGLHAPGLTVLCGGEAAQPGLFDRLAAAGAPASNVYGPTETTVWSTIAPPQPAGDPPLGRPLSGEQTYVLDEWLAPVPVGVDGELCIGGVGVARGYVGRPGQTAERFVPDPFATEPGRRMYRTGDVARFRGDGRLEFRGRRDGQVKIRGFRIETGEVEHLLSTHPAVAWAAVAAAGTGAGRHLVAAIETRPGTTTGPRELRAHLLARMPQAAIPAVFRIGRIPVSDRGKVDYRALAALPATASGADGPRTATQDALAAIWTELLGVDRPAADDDFFTLGGHSLLAMRVVTLVEQRMGRRIGVADVLTAPSLAGLAQRIDDGATRAAGPPPEAAGEGLLSDSQRRLWTLERLHPGATENVALAVRIEGPLDVDALQAAGNDILRRHDQLRASFPARDGRPIRVIAPARPHRIRQRDLGRMLPAVAERLVRRAAALPFDVEHGPLLRVALWRLGPDDHVLLAALHHLVVDAAAAAVLLDELSTLYAGRPLALAPPYACVASPARPEELDWWRRRLHGAPVRLLPPPPPGASAGTGGVVRSTLGPVLTAAVRDRARRAGTTPYVVVTAALAAALRRATGHTDLVLGTDVANREGAGRERAVGPFVNQAVLRIDIAAAATFTELITAVRAAVTATYPYAGVSYDRVVGALRAAGRLPAGGDLFDVKIAYQPRVDEALSLGPARITRLPRPAGVPREALVVFVLDGRDDITFELQHRDDVCGPGQAGDLLRSLIGELEAGVHETGRFRRRTPRSIALPTAGTEPPTLRPDDTGPDLPVWVVAHREELVGRLAEAGAVLFRGFGVDTPQELERVTAAFGEVPYRTTEHPREALGGDVFTPIRYPGREPLLWHHEDVFRDEYPARLWFACRQAADEGGETTVADAHLPFGLPGDTARRLADEGVMYVRRYGAGLGLDWPTVFGTTDRAEVEQACRAQGFAWQWDGDRLTTRAVLPAVRRHPVTGEPCWIAQVLHFHPAALPPGTRRSLTDLFGPDDLPRDCRHADGTPIDDAFVDRLATAYRSAEIACSWERGDLLVVDNVRVAHGRRPYTGDRKLLVYLGRPIRHDPGGDAARS
jgi:amino acid adenylation domain-containing protein